MLLTFTQWVQQQIKATPKSTLVSCPECNGEGVCLIECECCGHEHEEECEFCEGTGEVVFGELDQSDQARCFSRAAYWGQVTEDLRRYIEWQNNPLAALSLGFSMAETIGGPLPREAVFFDINTGRRVGHSGRRIIF